MKENKLIAEFMGVKPLILGGSTEYEMYGVLDCIEDGVDEKHFFIDDEMRFHESWDWLMPVVEKCLIGEAEQDEEISNTTIKNIYEGICNQDISYAYKSVVEFIKQIKTK